MSRFRFPCNCGKRMAAYDWMVGRIVTCPKCGRTITIPTPFQAEEQLAKMIESGYQVERRKIGIPVTRMSLIRKRILVIAGVVLALAAAAVLLWLIIF